jgi:HlyD family secretion protein
MSTPANLAGLLSVDATEPSDRAELRRQLRHTLLPLAIASALVSLWVVTAPLSGAIVAAGKLKAELNHKTVQHKEGGIVEQILVRDGDVVRAGQPLIGVGDVRNDAELAMLADQLAAERIRAARAGAEAALSPKFDVPAHVRDGKAGDAAKAAEHAARETALFVARRHTLDEQIASLEGQVRDAQAQATALAQQIDATERSAKLASEELGINAKLVEQGYVQRTRVLQLQREESDYVSRMSESRSDLALARQRAGEIQARIAQSRNIYLQQATDEAKESAARIRELEERLKPSRDQAERRFVRAPVDGKVLGLRVSAAGEVIGPGDPLLDIVPTREKLVVEAHIRPQDINHVHEDSAAEVRLSAFDSRTTPLLPGRVVLVSADRLSTPGGETSWYSATVEIDAAALDAAPGLELRAGMPAELFVATPERTLFQYLAKPLAAFASRAMREP